MVSFIIGLLVLLVVLYIVRLVVDAMGLPHPIPTIIYLLLGIVALFWILGALGIVASTPFNTLR